MINWITITGAALLLPVTYLAIACTFTFMWILALAMEGRLHYLRYVLIAITTIGGALLLLAGLATL